ncbi:MAG: hypothetical protein AAF687_05565 [Pseudomonadota bacterium]
MQPFKLLTLGLTFLGTVNASNAVVAKPKAIEGEPEILKEVPEDEGPVLYRQVFEIADRQAEPFDVTVAKAFSILGGEGKNFPAANIRVRCGISRFGGVGDRSCKPVPVSGRPVTEQDLDNQKLFYFAQRIDALPEIDETFREIEQTGGTAFLGRNWIFRREVEFTLSLPEYAAPSIDLTKGELVETKQVQLNQRRIRISYPSRAIREELEGDLHMECQIQPDLSIICADIRFDPPENADAFLTSSYHSRVRQTYGNLRSEPLLTTGESAIGKRFTTKLIYRLGPVDVSE